MLIEWDDRGKIDRRKCIHAIYVGRHARRPEERTVRDDRQIESIEMCQFDFCVVWIGDVVKEPWHPPLVFFVAKLQRAQNADEHTQHSFHAKRVSCQVRPFQIARWMREELEQAQEFEKHISTELRFFLARQTHNSFNRFRVIISFHWLQASGFCSA